MSKLGLADRRALKEFQDNYYPGWLKEFHAAAGTKIAVDVNWESLFFQVPEDMDRESLTNLWKNNFFEPLTVAFKALTTDEMGKKAVKDGIKKITINGAEANSASHSKLENGTFAVKFSPTNGANYPADIGRSWCEYLETKL